MTYLFHRLHEGRPFFYPVDLKDVLICGYTEGGVLYIRSSKMNCAEAFFLANKAAQWAQNGGQE